MILNEEGRIAIVTSHAGADSLGQALVSWGGLVPAFVEDGKGGMLEGYRRGMVAAYKYAIQAYLHDDVIIHDPDWAARVLKEFEDPRVGLVGFGGALGHGSPELYKAPYDYHQLGRSNFLSNMGDAETHGKRFTGSCDAAVLDGFSLIVRRELLEKAGGWPVDKLDYIGYDYWLSCMTRRLGYKIRLVGLRCAHLGGRTYVKLGIGDKPDHWQKYLDAHRYIYDEFKDVLPQRVDAPVA